MPTEQSESAVKHISRLAIGLIIALVVIGSALAIAAFPTLEMLFSYGLAALLGGLVCYAIGWFVLSEKTGKA